MKRPRYILLAAFAVLLVIALVFLLLPPAPLDLSHEEEPFKSMVLPLQTITGYTIMDGGSVRIDLVDKTGVQYDMCFDIDTTKVLNSHPTATYGTKTRRKEIPLKNPARAKVVAIRLLKDFGTSGDIGILGALEGLTDPIGDIAERLYAKTKRLLY
ncbi:MAG: hypothetical protein ABIS50_26930 [Luteolibacter sp.]|uniref:hypothetical protein n=1 Tax=Luteolibacter sp. TaxID=1962973 RepID=UPI0032639A59